MRFGRKYELLSIATGSSHLALISSHFPFYSVLAVVLLSFFVCLSLVLGTHSAMKNLLVFLWFVVVYCQSISVGTRQGYFLLLNWGL